MVLVPGAWSLVGDGLIDDAGSSLLLGFSPSLRERSEESRRLKLLVGGWKPDPDRFVGDGWSDSSSLYFRSKISGSSRLTRSKVLRIEDVTGSDGLPDCAGLTGSNGWAPFCLDVGDLSETI